jgi:hypothetical protein
MIWSAIVFYRNERRFLNGYSPHTSTFPQRKGRMVSCYLRSKVDLALHSSVTHLTNRLFHIELVKINHYKAPRDKLICILNCCKVIFGQLFSIARYII